MGFGVWGLGLGLRGRGWGLGGGWGWLVKKGRVRGAGADGSAGRFLPNPPVNQPPTSPKSLFNAPLQRETPTCSAATQTKPP